MGRGREWRQVVSRTAGMKYQTNSHRLRMAMEIIDLLSSLRVLTSIPYGRVDWAPREAR